MELAERFHPLALDAMQRYWRARAWSLCEALLIPELRDVLKDSPDEPTDLSDDLTLGLHEESGRVWAGTVGEYYRVYVRLELEGRFVDGAFGPLSVSAWATQSEAEAANPLVDRVEALEADGFKCLILNSAEEILE